MKKKGIKNAKSSKKAKLVNKKFANKNKIVLKDKLINNSKLLIKDLKRTRWPNAKEAQKSFIKSTIFIVIISLVLFGIAIGFSTLWNSLGVGING